VNVPFSLLSDGCTDINWLINLDGFYANIVSCLNLASRVCLPHRRVSSSQYSVPGWNTYVREKHDEARSSYLLWLEQGTPRYGVLYDDMRKSRAQFKLALRHCQQHLEEMKADACAHSVFDKDARKFWQDVYKMNNVRVTSNVITVGGKVGDREIADMWKQHYEQLYCTKYNEASHAQFLDKLQMMTGCSSTSVFSVEDVRLALHQQKCSKAVGPDGVPIEAYKYAGHRLVVYLTLFF